MALSRRWLLKPARTIRKLLRKLEGAPTPNQVHKLRTNVRRLQSLCGALDLDAKGGEKSFLKQLDRIRRRAGRVRDMDVLTELTTDLQLKGEEQYRVLLLEHLGSKRQKHAVKLQARAKKVQSRLKKELKAAASRMAEFLRGDKAAPGEAVIRLSGELPLPARLSRSNLHAYRLKVKELQDLLLLIQSPKQHKFVEDLGALKDAIGEWHDWEKLLKVATKLFHHGQRRPSFLAQLTQIAKAKYDLAISLAIRLREAHLSSSGAVAPRHSR